MSTKEVEIRYELRETEYAKLFNTLSQIGWVGKESMQEDVYFCNHVYVDQGKTRECPYVVRLRKSQKNKLAYKSFLPDKTWIELETEITDPDAMFEILQKLNQSPYLSIKKHRLSGQLGNIEINLDVIEGLGYFVEMEYLMDEEKQTNNIFDELVEKLGLYNKIVTTTGYVQLMEQKLAKKNAS